MTPTTFLALSLTLLMAAGASAQVPAGGEFRAGADTAGDQESVRPVMDADGDIVVVWRGPDGSGGGILGRRFARTGDPRGGDFAINTYTTAGQVNPAAAMGRKGDLVVVWQGRRATDATDQGIQGRRFDSTGSPIGGEFSVNSSASPAQYRPDVARAADGHFVVVWNGPTLNGLPGGIVGRRFDAFGAPVGADFEVTPWVQGPGSVPAIGMEPDGTFVVAWNSFPYYGDSVIYGRRYRPDGMPLDSPTVVNTQSTGLRVNPSVSTSEVGTVIAWNAESGDGDGSAVAARHYDAGATPTANEFVVNTYTTGMQLGAGRQVAHDEQGNFVVTWQGPGPGNGYGISGQRFGADGLPRGAEFQVNVSTFGARWSPSVASDAVGNFVVAWQDFDGSGTGIVARRFGGLGPAALEIDTAGDGVLDPGENVTARPAWRNFSGAAQTVSAGLIRMGGPAGAVYTIVDGTGDYGTVGDGLEGACTDCYAVEISTPARRPAQHWDAFAVESIVPDAQGQQQKWLLHVGGSFTDVPTASPAYRQVETLFHLGITAGCALSTVDTFCPSAPTTRGAMAPLLLLAREGADFPEPKCSGTVFDDVTNANPSCAWIEELARRGVVTGCGPGLYCPDDPVTRGQMAVFVLRTLVPGLVPPPCVPPNIYNDVPETHPFCSWIEELANRGVVSDCGGGNYCPAGIVSREQMAVFVVDGFGLTLYGTEGVAGVAAASLPDAGREEDDPRTSPPLERTALPAPSAEALLSQGATDEACANTPPGCATIAFVSARDGDEEIYSVAADGTGLVRLTHSPGTDEEPAWSPDGQRIAFVSARSGYHEIYVMNADGSNVVQRSFHSWVSQTPAWSPDGTKIAYAALSNGSLNLWVVSPDAGGPTPTLLFEAPGWDGQPTWSPDGARLALVSDWVAYDFVLDIYLVNADGSGFTALTGNIFDAIDYVRPSWSPSGAKLAVIITERLGPGDYAMTVGVMNADGSGLTPLISAGIGEYTGMSNSWSPDGQRIAFTAFTGTGRDISWVASDGSASGLIVSNGWNPSWRR